MILIERSDRSIDQVHHFLIAVDHHFYQIVGLDDQDVPLWAYGQSLEPSHDTNVSSAILESLEKAVQDHRDVLHDRPTEIAINSQLFTIVPQELDTLEDKKKYFDHLGFLCESDNILSDELNHVPATLYYSISNRAHNRLERLFGTFTVRHYLSPFINHAIFKQADDIVHVHVMQHKAVYFVKLGGQLIQASNFYFHTEDDLLYHIMTIYQLHQISHDNVPLYFSGHIYKQAPITETIKKYVRSSSFLKMETDAASKWNSLERPAHYFYDLQALSLCA